MSTKTNSNSSPTTMTGSDTLTPAIEASISSIEIYITDTTMWLIGTKTQEEHFVLHHNRIPSSSSTEFLDGNADKRVYNQKEISVYKNQLATTYPTLKHVGNAHGLLGFVRFTEGWYCHLIWSKKQVGVIGGHPIYTIQETKLIPVNKSKLTSTENRMKSAYEACDLSGGDFYLSHTYELTHTLQENVKARQHAKDKGSSAVTSNDRFIWNALALQGLIMCVGVPSCWILPIIHGFFEQKHVQTTTKRKLTLTLIARRSRYFAGTRYNRRGSDMAGNVANEVETEQLLCDTQSGMSTSLVQVRGSIPLQWCHYNLRSPKPGFKIYKSDDTFGCAKLHFDDLKKRYGNRLALINLIRQQEDIPKELILLKEFGKCMTYLNTCSRLTTCSNENNIEYVAYDFNTNAKDPNVDVLQVVDGILQNVSKGMGFFSSSRPRGKSSAWVCQMQQGVVRTNCIDCLDRTNVTQFCLGKQMLPLQLEALGIELLPQSINELWPHLMHMWARHGNEMGMQYAGSGAMHSLTLDNSNDDVNDTINVNHEGDADDEDGGDYEQGEDFTRVNNDVHRLSSSSMSSVPDVTKTKKVVLTKGVKNAMVAVTRYLSNNFTDDQRQKNIDQLLGLIPMTQKRDESCIPSFLEQLETKLLKNESMYVAAVSNVPSILCMQILRKSQHRTFEEKYCATELTSFNDTIGMHDDTYEPYQDRSSNISNDSNTSSTSNKSSKRNKSFSGSNLTSTRKNSNLKDSSATEVVSVPGTNDPNGGGILNPILIHADEISTTNTTLKEEVSIKQKREQRRTSVHILQQRIDELMTTPSLPYEGMWRVASNYDQFQFLFGSFHRHEDQLVHRLILKYQQEDDQNFRKYNEYCAIQSTKVLLNKFLFKRRSNKKTNHVKGTTNDANDANDANGVNGVNGVNDEGEKESMHISVSHPSVYQDGEFTSFSNRRNSWMMNHSTTHDDLATESDTTTKKKSSHRMFRFRKRGKSEN